MDLRQLRYFVAIVEQGSFSKAAQLLNVAQPALSLHVRNMEADFGKSLLFRKAQGVFPTQAGEILLRDARSIIRQFQATRQEIQEFDAEPQGDVKIGMSASISPFLGVSLLLDTKTKFPKIKVKIAEAMSGFVLEWLKQGRIDIGFLYQPVKDGGLRSIPVLSEDLLLVGPKTPLIGVCAMETDYISYADLSKLPLIMPSTGHGLRDIVQAKALAMGHDLNVVLDLDAYACFRPLLQHGLGYAILPANVVARDRTDGLRTWTIGEKPLHRTIYLVHHNDRPLTRAVGAVIEICSKTFEQMVSNTEWRGASRTDIPGLFATETSAVH
ncbi:LysR substrate-binding domain-containing protein [Lichenihabitans psoromatis]|uniref:LysR substrate-binding domain-containing protein n=1 Tax=Lichenihabitans psoromatis TaxID=2528642 RepID=UPI0013F151BD|nr:LysR substrate-binding domain-containing protein [Lichenihabitans psoromatis]